MPSVLFVHCMQICMAKCSCACVFVFVHLYWVKLGFVVLSRRQGRLVHGESFVSPTVFARSRRCDSRVGRDHSDAAVGA